MKKSYIALLAVSVLLVISLIAGISYAFFMKAVNQTSENLVKSGCFNIVLSNEENAINLQRAFPVTDIEGMAYTPYIFTINNNCTLDASYDVMLDFDASTNVDFDFIKLAVDDEFDLLSSYPSGSIYYPNASSSKKIAHGVLNSGDDKTFNIRMWVASNATNDDVGSSQLSAKIHIDAVVNHN